MPIKNISPRFSAKLGLTLNDNDTPILVEVIDMEKFTLYIDGKPMCSFSSMGELIPMTYVLCDDPEEREQLQEILWAVGKRLANSLFDMMIELSRIVPGIEKPKLQVIK